MVILTGILYIDEKERGKRMRKRNEERTSCRSHPLTIPLLQQVQKMKNHRKKGQWRKLVKKAAALIVAAAVLVSTEGVTGIRTQGVITAEAATVKKKSCDMAIAETLKLDSQISGKSKSATYTYKSSKTSVASVSKKGVVTAKKAGKTQITITEVKGGKKKTVGTVKVTVHKLENKYGAYAPWDAYWSAAEGLYEKYPVQLKLEEECKYINPKATYTWFCDRPEVMTITKKGKITHVNNNALTTKDYGYEANYKFAWVTIFVKETYKGKTNKFTVGSIRFSEQGLEEKSGYTIKVKKGQTVDILDNDPHGYVAWGTYGYRVLISSELYETEQKVWAALNDSSDADEDADSDYIFEWIYDKDGYWTGEIKAKETGKLYVYYFSYNYTKDEYDKYLGYYVINITE